MTGTADNTNIGAGQQFPETSNSEFSVAAFIIKQYLADLEIMAPVQVKAVKPGSGSPPVAGTVDVQLLVSQLDGNGNAVKQGVVYGIPYFRLQGGQWAIVLDPAVGDFGYIVCAQRDITNVKKNPGMVNPGSFRKFSYSDGIYMGGAFNQVPDAYLWLKTDGSFKLAAKGGFVIESDTAGNGVITGNLTVNGNLIANDNLQLGGLIQSSSGGHYGGNIQTSGNVIAGFGGGDQVGLQSHVHSGVQVGGGSTAAPTAGT